MKNQVIGWILILLAILLLTSCAESTPVQACVTGEPYGFWSGLWHGLISPIMFIVSLFKDTVAVYAVNNSGGWYDFGFMLGVSIVFGGSGRAS